MIRPKFELDFRELDINENLYDNEDLDRCTTVEAEYIFRTGFEDNPDVCAIPKAPSTREIITNSSVNIIGFDRSKLNEMKKYEKLEYIEELDYVMTPLGVHFDVSQSINSLLIKSYKSRDVMVASVEGNSPIQKQGFACNILALRKDVAPRPTGFFLYGKTGCGKSMAVQLACRMYPKAIIHNLNGISYTQIPIIYVTALKRQTSDVFRSIATRIDEILNTGDFHESKVRSGTITKMEGYIKNWIKLYHIGLIIIDEIQFLALDKNAKSIEDIIGITQDTGCNFGFIGNEDAKVKLFELPRIYGRVEGNLIDADFVTANGNKLFEFAMSKLWRYQWTECESPLTDEIKDYLTYETAINIALLKYIIIKIQSEAVIEGRKAPIDINYVKNKTDKDIKKLRELITEPTEKEEKEYREYMTRLRAKVAAQIADEKETGRGEIVAMMERGKLQDEKATIIDRVIQSISDTTEYSENNIYRTVLKILDEEPSLIDYPPRILATRVKQQLDGIEKKKKRKNLQGKKQHLNVRKIDKNVKESLMDLAILN